MTATATRSETAYQAFIRGRIESFRQKQRLLDTETAKIALFTQWYMFKKNFETYVDWVDSLVDEEFQWKNRPD